MKIFRDTSRVTQVTTRPPDAAPALPPALQAYVTKRSVIAALRGQLAGHQRRLDELRPQESTITGMRTEHAALTDEFQALRAQQLRGQEVDTAMLRDLESRMLALDGKLYEGRNEAASLSRAISALHGDCEELKTQIDQHSRELPSFLAAAARERSIGELKAGRLKQLMEHIATELAEIFAGATVSELQRVQFPNAGIGQCVSLRIPELGSLRGDELILPVMEGSEYRLALQEACSGTPVIDLMRERAQQVLTELLEEPRAL